MFNFLSRIGPIVLIVAAFGYFFLNDIRQANFFVLPSNDASRPGEKELIEYHSLLGTDRELPAYLKEEKHNPALLAETINQIAVLHEREQLKIIHHMCFLAMHYRQQDSRIVDRAYILLHCLFDETMDSDTQGRQAAQRAVGILQPWETIFVTLGIDAIEQQPDLFRYMHSKMHSKMHQGIRFRTTLVELPTRTQAQTDLMLLFETKDWRPGHWDQMSEIEQQQYETKLKKHLQEQVDRIAE